MTLRACLFAGSIVLNGTLLGALVVRPAFAPPALRDFFARHFHREAPAAAPVAKAPPPKPAARQPLWPQLDANGDLQTLITRLRAAGFPADIIRAMIMAEISARYDPKIRALFEPDASTPFWKASTNFFAAGDKRMEQYGQLQRERAKLQRELLADPFFASDDVTAAQRRQFGNLSRLKIDLLQRIEDDYSEMNAAIRAATNGIILAEDREKLELLTREKRADLASVLSPEELADYEMRSSPVTNMLSQRLGGFNPTEAEFRAIFQAQQAFSEKLGVRGLGAANFEEREAAQQQLNDQLKANLGDARYTEYLRETDTTYQQLLRLTQRENLPADAAVRAYNIKDNVARESGRIADDASLSADQKRAALQSLAESTRNELLGLLGPNAGPTYVKLLDSRWLNMVQRGYAVSFNTGSGTSMMTLGSASGGMPVSVSFGGNPNFRNVAQPRPAPRP
jgi:hypothetical protein